MLIPKHKNPGLYFFTNSACKDTELNWVQSGWKDKMNYKDLQKILQTE